MSEAAAADPRDESVLRPWIAALVIAGAILVAFHRAGAVPFLFDDPHSIEANESIRHLWPPAYWMGAREETTAAGRPLVNLSLALNYAAGALEPAGYHAFNLGVHVLAALLLFLLLRHVLRAGSFRAASGCATEFAAAVALLWAVHPLQAHAVTYVIQRAETLMGLCLFLALLAAARSFTSPRPAGWSVLSVAACFLGLGAKEVMAVAPILILLLDRTLFAGSFRGALRRRALYAGLFLSWVGFAWLLVRGARTGTVGFGFDDVTPLVYAKHQCVLVARYLRLVLWPDGLAIDYGWPPEPGLAELVGPAALLAILLLSTLYGTARRHPLGLVGCSFFLVLAPSSSLLPISSEIGAEHRMHVPLAAVLVALAGLLLPVGRRVLSAGLRRPLGLGLTLGMALALSLTLDRRHAVMADPVALWESDLRVWPGNPRAYLQLIVALRKRYDPPAALEHFRRFVAAQDEAPRVLAAMAYRMKEEAPPGFVIHLLQTSLSEEPGFAPAHYELAQQYLRLGDAARHDEQLQLTVRADPGHGKACAELGLLRARQGKVAEAVALLEVAAEEFPGDAQVLGNLGVAYQQAGRLEPARIHLTRALEQEPDQVEIRISLARVLQSLDDLTGALEQCEAVLARDAGNVLAERLQRRLKAQLRKAAANESPADR